MVILVLVLLEWAERVFWRGLEKQMEKLFPFLLLFLLVMSNSKKESAKGGGEPAITPNPPASSGTTQGKTYARATGKVEVKDSVPVFEIRLHAPQQKQTAHHVIQELIKGTAKSSLLGVRQQHKDYIASFRDEKERNLLTARGSIKVQGIVLSLSTFPPPSMGTKHFLYDVPMVATGAGVAKGLEPVKPTKWFFEHHTNTHVRTGRVMFWTEVSSLPDYLSIVDVRCPIKTPGKKKAEKSTQAEKPQQCGTPLDTSAESDKTEVVVKVPPPINLQDSVIPDEYVFDNIRKEGPDRPGLLEIYEGLTKKEDEVEADRLIPTVLGISRAVARVDTGATYTFYALRILGQEAKDAVKALDAVKKRLAGENKTWEKRGWIHYITAPEGGKVLVVYKSRIANDIKRTKSQESSHMDDS